MAHDDTEKPDATLLDEACEAVEKAELYLPHMVRGPTREHRERYGELWNKESDRARNAVRKLNPALSGEFDEATRKYDELGQRTDEALRKSWATGRAADQEAARRAMNESSPAFNKMMDAQERYDETIKTLCTKPPSV